MMGEKVNAISEQITKDIKSCTQVSYLHSINWLRNKKIVRNEVLPGFF